MTTEEPASDDTIRAFYRIVDTYEARQNELRRVIREVNTRIAELELRKLEIRKKLNEWTAQRRESDTTEAGRTEATHD
jgi:hypothetical protein